MLLWFAGLSLWLVWVVFRSPALDYRLVMAGALLPVGEAALGGPWLLHTLLASVTALTVVVLATVGRRLVRRRWLGVPIGLFVHLVLDGTWARTELFWWPLFGTDLGADQVPELSRGVPWVVLLELIGAGVLWWCARRFGLEDRARRRRFGRTGQLDRSLVGGT